MAMDGNRSATGESRTGEFYGILAATSGISRDKMVGTNSKKVELKDSILGNIEEYIDANIENVVKSEMANLDIDSKIQSVVRLEIGNLNIEAKIQDAVKRELSKMKNYDVQHDESGRKSESSAGSSESSASSSEPNSERVPFQSREANGRAESKKQLSQKESCTTRNQSSQECLTVPNMDYAPDEEVDLFETNNGGKEPMSQCSQDSQNIPTQPVSSNNAVKDNYSQQSQSDSQKSDSHDSDYAPSEISQNESPIVLVKEKKSSPRKHWKKTCENLLTKLMNHKDSKPFRQRVDEIEDPNYAKEITVPMDLATIGEELESGNYKNIKSFFKDVDLIFSNSRQYNPIEKSRIYKQTTRLMKMYESEKEDILASGKSQTPKKASPAKKTPLKNRARRRILSSDGENDDDNVEPRAKKLKTGSRTKCAGPSNLESDDTDYSADESDQQSNYCAPGRRTRSSTLRERTENRRYGSNIYYDSENEDNEEDDEDKSSSTSSNEESDGEDSGTVSIMSDEDSNESGVVPPPIVTLTTSQQLDSIEFDDRVSIVARVLSADDKPLNIPSKDRMRFYKLYKFILTNDDGKHVQCQAWEELGEKICGDKLKRNQIVTLKNVKAVLPHRPWYNNGNMDYVIEYKLYSQLIKEPKETIVQRN
ncbi:hypothetical protein QAD02_014715 [Eretmocerus hayati]|uniref:Uncharacterized protein n=1 Tax=Eretmocerus hayati TaxID=131215 RepID=A0ACC2P760_9HYME|nr:hypothetical protein QAD02_014715 [Eretmocerus hayati]